jgi:hypothetical protein
VFVTVVHDWPPELGLHLTEADVSPVPVMVISSSPSTGVELLERTAEYVGDVAIALLQKFELEPYKSSTVTLKTITLLVMFEGRGTVKSEELPQTIFSQIHVEFPPTV